MIVFVTRLHCRDVTRMVDEAVAAVVKPSNNRVYTEVLRHLHTSQTFASDFEGRAEVTLHNALIRHWID